MYPSSRQSQSIAAGDVFLLLPRVALAIIVVIFQLAPEATTGWAAIWHEQPWPLAETVAALGLPRAPWIVASAVVLSFLATLGLCCGFITRVSSAILLGGALLGGYNAVAAGEAQALELALVYGSVFAFFVLRGPGAISADRFFKNRKA